MSNETANRWLITAPNPEAVDEWWREASEKSDVRRLSPDFYTYTNGTPPTFAPTASAKIMFTLMYDRDSRVTSIFDQPDRTDVVGGNAYVLSPVLLHSYIIDPSSDTTFVPKPTKTSTGSKVVV